MIKIFSPGKTIFLISEQRLFRESGNSIMASVSSAEEMRRTFQELAGNTDLHHIFFYHPDEARLLDFFSSMFRIVRAAGGLVRNAEGKYLFIFRHGKWDLPKGKIEKGEDIRSAAVREVEEECGVHGLKNVRELFITYHTYLQDGEAILKPTHWFSMETADASGLVPQREEGITDVQWLDVKDLEMVKKNTFPSILELIAAMDR